MRVTGCAAVVVAAASLVFAGCYGSTEPASDVGFDAAVLHGKGTANSGPAESFFEYWPSSFPARKAPTPPTSWPAGVTGPFSTTVRALAPATDYAFRLCGRDEGRTAVCAQTRTFRTATPEGDLVIGEFQTSGSFRPVEVDARSGPSGADPHGSMSMRGVFGGTVVAISVEGNRAAVRAAGRASIPGSGASFAAEACLRVVDGGADTPPGSGDSISYNMALTELGEELGSCLVPPPGSTGGSGGPVAVYDAH
jgi:hypothetical protein